MKDYLKHYKVTLNIMSPVFIGSGSELTKKEYIKSGKKIIIPKFEEMYMDIVKMQKKQSFEAYMTDPGNHRSIDNWIRDEGIKWEYLDKWTKYTLDCSGLTVDKKMQIMTFVKDEYGNPYIPGSSIKGALRTILLVDDIMEYPSKYEQIKREMGNTIDCGGKVNRKYYLNNENRQINQIAFHTLKRSEKVQEIVNDMLAGLIVGDSEPLSTNELIVCQKIDRHTEKYKKNYLPIARECLKPGTKVYFDLTIDTSLCDVSLERIERAIKNFTTMYNNCFISKYENVKPLNPNQFFLGGGSGFVSKTVIYALYGKDGTEKIVNIFNNTNVPRKHGHDIDSRKGVSPHTIKMTETNNKTFKFGLCTLTFEQT